MTMTHAQELQAGDRFEFGANWARFLSNIDETRIKAAERSLQDMLGDIRGKRFLDAGSGSGLFSLAARNLGAIVHSFDYDPKSVGCTRELRGLFASNDATWTIEEGSVLDKAYLAKLGKFDVVYSWGVLHHTGAMEQAFANVAELVSPGGQLFIAIYNDQGWKSRAWHTVKRLYNRGPVWRTLIVAAHIPFPLAARYLVRVLTGRLRLERGMSLWYDLLDWLGGYPFEVATAARLVQFFEKFGFSPQIVRDVGDSAACNEVVLRKA
jgi:2-polyprenyl-3-methyl-5-hydroxy-6-metoxy-1,4-benzoquinol methylase